MGWRLPQEYKKGSKEYYELRIIKNNKKISKLNEENELCKKEISKFEENKNQ